MQPRLDYRKAAPVAVHAMYRLQDYVDEGGLERPLLDLVKTRVSQMNGCAYCIDMHTKDARAAGESEQRLYDLSPWRESPFYTERERAALAWAEDLTLISPANVSDEAYEAALAQFSEEELVRLTMAVVAINGWNRLALAFRPRVGSYQPQDRTEQPAPYV